MVVIVNAKRTAIGSFGGSLKDISPQVMGTKLIEQSLKEIGLSPCEIDEVIIGNVLSAGLGQNIARQMQIFSGIPEEKTAFCVNKVCGSSLKAIELGYQTIMLDNSQVIIAGGAENMSMSPYLATNMRYGARMGDTSLVDSVVHDGLWDIFNNYHMGITAENIAKQFSISREEQDEFALQSQLKAKKAQDSNRFQAEIVPISIQLKKETIEFKNDEFIKNTSLESLNKLKPAFEKEGSVTAGNSSGINDGASIVVLMSEQKAKNLGLKPLARIVSFGKAGCNPKTMGLGPVNATHNALKNANLQLSDIDIIELNEAFAAQSLGVIKSLGLDSKKVNLNGGAIALGHPIGASGARIVTTLLHEMQKQDARYALASLCIGGGQGISMIVEKI